MDTTNKKFTYCPHLLENVIAWKRPRHCSSTDVPRGATKDGAMMEGVREAEDRATRNFNYEESNGLLFVVLGIGLLSLVIALIRKLKWRRKTNVNVENFLKNHDFLGPKRYTYSQIKKMTNSFEIKLGEGGFGSVYKGALSNGNLVAVKVLSELKGNGEDFVNEIASVVERSKISMSRMRGTPGYIAPELLSMNFGHVSHKSDVYSYGMMILEMVGGRKNIEVEVDHTSEIYFPHWIYKKVELHEEKLELHGIVNDEENEMAMKMMIVGLWCIQTNPLSRPTTTKVLEMLEGDLASIEIPPKPYLSSPSRSVGSLSTN
ncbi:hypothetical protein L6452_18110 [Arctium lappa]|uniref:Uncharacterized protein n=1 Tax=Arctium lappa TaxID=4217 RepID=A0ACB9C548_ARCLA|nr:hypothetical protein L6452_18110 [Arctium lappa]